MGKAIFVRPVQGLMAIVALGLAAALIKEQRHGTAPAAIGFTAFASAFGVVACIVGVIAITTEIVPPIIAVGADGLATLVLLAAGIALAVQLKTTDCGGIMRRAEYPSDLITAGCTQKDAEKAYGCYFDGDINKAINFMIGRCRMVQADSAFAFIAAVASGAAAALTLMSSRRK